MSLENFGSNLESQEELPKLQEASKEDVQKVWESIKHSIKLVKTNDVLQILDFPDNIEESFRKTLDKQTPEILNELSTKSKKDILIFLKSKKLNTAVKEENNTIKTEIKETQTQSKENEKINSKISKIKSVFTNDILNKNPDIRGKLNTFDSLENPLEKDEVLKDILEILKQPWKLKSIIDGLGWADKNNPKYLEFKDSLVWLDSSFESYFNELENINVWTELNTNEIITEIENESWWTLDIDLNSNKPMSKLSLIWSDYSFDEEIDKQALDELMSDSSNKIEEVQNSFAILKGLYKPFDSLLTQIKSNWWKLGFKENLENAVNSFSKDIFSEVGDVYKDMDIDSNIQINESDITSLKDVKKPSELKSKIETIKDKLLKIKTQVWETQAWILKDYKQELKELVKRKEEAKEKQLEVLEFMKASWFDLIPKDISNRIIKELQSNTLTIPWLELNRNNIDLKNGHFWESWAFVNKEGWINIESKINLVKFVNKLISWDINEPSSVEAIASGSSVSNESFMKNKFLEAWVVDWLGWKYGKIIENLKE